MARKAKSLANIESLARSHTETAINVLAGIMRQDKAPPSARVAAANAILDRGWGKPSQQLDIAPADPVRKLMEDIDGTSRGLPSEHGSVH